MKIESIRLLFFACTLVVPAAYAQSAAVASTPWSALERKCWASYANQRTSLPRVDDGVRSVAFSNVRDGYKIYSPFKVEFAVRGMGVAPAGQPLDGAGHHHILIDRSLPRDIVAGLPFDDKHKHFGKGQTSTVLDLSPGKHTLRLLFADHQHRPYFIFSDQITIEVLATRSALLRTGTPKIDPTRFDATCPGWYQNVLTEPRPGDAVAHFLNLRDGDVIATPFNVRLGTEGFGVCSADVDAEKSGHFSVEVRSASQLLKRAVLRDGQTQTDLDLRPGDYELRTELRDRGGRSIGVPQSISVRVVPTRRGQ